MADGYDSTITSEVTLDAEFRAWVDSIHDLLTDAGMVQTADTGQIDTATVSAPASTGAKQGYEIWRFADTEQANHPIFFRLDYGCTFHSGSFARPGLWVTLGKGSDGAGAITDAIVSDEEIGSGSSSSAAAIGGRSYGEEGVLVLYIGSDLTSVSDNRALMIWIERTRDADGTPNDVAAMMNLIGGSTPGDAGYLLSKTGAGVADTTDAICPMAGPVELAHVDAAGGVCVVSAYHTIGRNQVYGYAEGLLAMIDAHDGSSIAAPGDFIEITVRGSARVYQWVPRGNTATGYGNQNVNPAGLLIPTPGETKDADAAAPVDFEAAGGGGGAGNVKVKVGGTFQPAA